MDDGGGGSGHGGRHSGIGAGGGANTGTESVDDRLDELWPVQRPSATAARLAQIWVANPETSERWTYGLGGVELVFCSRPLHSY